MISAIVLVPDAKAGDVARQREIAVRSLGWLVSAVVSGVVRDVNLAAPAALDLGEVADKVGCGLLADDSEGRRLAEAGRASRCDRVLVMQSGFQPLGNLVEEIDLTQCRGAAAGALVLKVPTAFRERLLPDSAAVGVLTTRGGVIGIGSRGFRALSRATKGFVRLHTRVQPIP